MVEVLLGVLSVLTLVEVTPKHFSDFTSTWGKAINTLIQVNSMPHDKK